eukprot:gene6647-biopygen20904
MRRRRRRKGGKGRENAAPQAPQKGKGPRKCGAAGAAKEKKDEGCGAARRRCNRMRERGGTNYSGLTNPLPAPHGAPGERAGATLQPCAMSILHACALHSRPTNENLRRCALYVWRSDANRSSAQKQHKTPPSSIQGCKLFFYCILFGFRPRRYRST